MIENRYEEYLSFSDNIPFILKSKIKRSASVYSKESNWHDNIEIELCVEGHGAVLIDGKKLAFSKGDIAVINSNAIHYTGTGEEMIYTCLIIDTDFCKQADIDPSRIKFMEMFHDEAVEKTILEIENVYKSIDDPCRVAKLRMLTLSLLIALKENYALEYLAETQSGSSYENVKTAIKYIRQNYMHKFSLEDLAASVYTNKYVLARQFKKVTKQSIVEYVNGYRCRQAELMISNGKSVSAAAELCGFSNMSFFTKTFKRFMGKLPSDCKTRESLKINFQINHFVASAPRHRFAKGKPPQNSSNIRKE